MLFNEEKATAAAAFLLKQRGGRMSYLKLIKLLYLVDRESLLRWGFSITTDRYVSMEHGPVVSNTYNLMLTGESCKFWPKYITPPLGEYEIELRSESFPDGQLSAAEEGLLLEIFATYGTWGRWKLRDFTHTLPEWHDPGNSSVPIQISEMLEAQGVTPEEVAGILAEMGAAERADQILGTRS
jgi:uncharacterized phage-associated protein